MKLVAAALAGVLSLGPGYVSAQDVGSPAPSEPANTPTEAAQPPTPAPNRTPPPPPARIVPPTQAQVQTVPAPAARTAPGGQWVYTQQYGWVWMPYGSQYTYTPTDTGTSPYEYLYYPTYGWTWLAAPWVFGWGASPFFGALGPRHFVWYNHAFYGGAFGPGYRPFYGGAYRQGFVGHPGYGPGFVGHPGYGGPRPGYVGARPGYGVPGGGFGAHGTFQGRPAAPSGGFHGGFGHGGGFGGGHGGGGHR
jgi:hypothetical protein